MGDDIGIGDAVAQNVKIQRDAIESATKRGTHMAMAIRQERR